MNKEFDLWNTKKKVIHSLSERVYYHEREVWWCSLGINVGFEQDGTGKNFDRPVVIIKGFNSNVCFVAALTGKKRAGKYYFYLGRIAGREASAILSQVRLVDTKRLVRKIMTLDEWRFEKLKTALKAVLLD